MPFGSLNPSCSRCNIKESTIWRKVLTDELPIKEEILCNDCSIELKKTRIYLNDKINNFNKEDNQDKESDFGSNSQINKKDSSIKSDLKEEQSIKPKMLTRKSTRNKRGPYKQNQNNRNLSNKDKGRRNIFKLRNVYKSPSSISYPMTRDSCYHNGTNYQIGDIVSMVDADDGTTYFAQIRGFLQDQFCEKSAAVTWLIPRKTFNEFKPISEFSPSDYILGPEEDYARKLDCMEFVCRCPSDYFKSSSPYIVASPSHKKESGYVITSRFGPIIFNSTIERIEDLE